MTSFKVGDRVRFVNPMHPGQSYNPNMNELGTVAALEPKTYGIDVHWDESGNFKAGVSHNEIELAEGGRFFVASLDYVNPLFDAQWTMNQFMMSYCGETIKPKRTIMKTLNTMMKKLLDADTQTLVKAGYINGDLELTSEGRAALNTIVFQANKKELVAMAQEELDAEKTN